MSEWSSQFIAMLESLRLPTLFQQGRRFVRSGHVRQVTISSSIATALVLDDGQLYRARIAVRAFSSADWSRLERAIGDQAIYAGKLLAGVRARHVRGEESAPPRPPEPPISGFWTAGPRLAPPTAPLAATVRRPDALLDQLDPLHLAAGRNDVVDTLRAVYRAAADPPGPGNGGTL